MIKGIDCLLNQCKPGRLTVNMGHLLKYHRVEQHAELDGKFPVDVARHGLWVLSPSKTKVSSHKRARAHLVVKPLVKEKQLYGGYLDLNRL